MPSRDLIPGGRRELVWLCVTGAFIAITQSMTLPLVALYSQALDAGPSLTGLVLTAGFVLPIMCAVPVGHWVDRLGAKPVITLGALGLALAPLWPVLYPSLVTLALLQLLTGIAHLGSVVAAQSYTSRLAGSRERNFGWYSTLVSLGQLVGPFLLGGLIEIRGYRSTLVVSGISAVGAAIASRFLSRLSVVRTDIGGASASRLQPRLRFRANLPLRTAMIASGAILFALGIHQTFFPVYLSAQDISPSTIGVLVGLRAVAAVMVRPFLPAIGRLFRSRSIALSCMLLLGGLSLFLMPTGGSLAVLASVLLGIGSGVAQPLTMVVLSDHIDEGQRGAALGARLSANFLALGASTLLLSLLIPTLGFSLSFLICAVLICVVVLLILLRGRSLEAPRPVCNYDLYS